MLYIPEKKMHFAQGEGRTINLVILSQTPYPLRHAAQLKETAVKQHLIMKSVIVKVIT